MIALAHDEMAHLRDAVSALELPDVRLRRSGTTVIVVIPAGLSVPDEVQVLRLVELHTDDFQVERDR